MLAFYADSATAAQSRSFAFAHSSLTAAVSMIKALPTAATCILSSRPMTTVAKSAPVNVFAAIVSSPHWCCRRVIFLKSTSTLCAPVSYHTSSG